MSTEESKVVAEETMNEESKKLGFKDKVNGIWAKAKKIWNSTPVRVTRRVGGAALGLFGAYSLVKVIANTWTAGPEEADCDFGGPDDDFPERIPEETADETMEEVSEN